MNITNQEESWYNGWSKYYETNYKIIKESLDIISVILNGTLYSIIFYFE